MTLQRKNARGRNYRNYITSYTYLNASGIILTVELNL